MRLHPAATLHVVVTPTLPLFPSFALTRKRGGDITCRQRRRQRRAGVRLLLRRARRQAADRAGAVCPRVAAGAPEGAATGQGTQGVWHSMYTAHRVRTPCHGPMHVLRHTAGGPRFLSFDSELDSVRRKGAVTSRCHRLPWLLAVVLGCAPRPQLTLPYVLDICVQLTSGLQQVARCVWRPTPRPEERQRTGTVERPTGGEVGGLWP